MGEGLPCSSPLAVLLVDRRPPSYSSSTLARRPPSLATMPARTPPLRWGSCCRCAPSPLEGEVMLVGGVMLVGEVMLVGGVTGGHVSSQ